MSVFPRTHLVALSILLSCVVFRGVVGYDPFPGWADDPTRLPASVTTIGPLESIALDLIMLLAASMVIGTGWLYQGRPDRAIARAWRWGGTGLVMVVVWSWRRPGDVDVIVIGLNWAAAVLSGCAIWCAGREAAFRRVVASVLLGTIGLLVTKACGQYFIDNPQAYADFRVNKASIFAAHGWNADSPLAKSFERRLSQPDAGGWFGLSNVLGSVAAGSVVALGGMLVQKWRDSRSADGEDRTGLAGVAIGVVASIVTLGCSMSKGAILAACTGLGLLLLSRVRPLRRVAGWLGVLCIAGPLLAVVVRGILGEQIGELSLLFRWFYMQGAGEIIGSRDGLLGVGPGGFQDVYMRVKPALSPENVSSPHSLMLDWLSMLGVFVLPWCVLVIGAAWRGGRNLFERPDSPPESIVVADGTLHDARPFRLELRLVVAIAAIPTLLAAAVEREIATPLSTGVRLGGLFLFAMIASGVLRCLRGSSGVASWRWGVPIAAGALTTLMHAQVEMVGTTSGSCAWCLCLFGLAAVTWSGDSKGASRREGGSDRGTSNSALDTRSPNRWLAALPVFLVFFSIAVLSPRVLAIWSWQSSIVKAATLLRPIPLSQLLATNAGLGSSQDRLREAADVLSVALGRRVDAIPGSVEAAMRQARVRLADLAIVEMSRACDVMPGHAGTHRAASELMLTQGLVKRSLGDAGQGQELLNRARRTMEVFVGRERGKASSWAWLGLLNRTLATEAGDASANARAIEAYTAACVLDPYGVVNVPPLVDLLMVAGKASEAREWAAAGLKRHAKTRLDPLAGLPNEQMAKLRAVAGGT